MTLGSLPGSAQPVPDAAGQSRFAQRLRRRYANELALLPAGAPAPATMAQAYEALRTRGLDTAAALRVLREHDPQARQADDLELARKILAAR